MHLSGFHLRHIVTPCGRKWERILDGFLHVPLEEDVFSFALRGTSLVNSLAETLLLFIFLVCIENGLRLCSHRRRV